MKFSTPPQAPRKEFKTCPEGTHVARCVSFVDIGTHEFEWQGEKKTPRKVRISWETPNETTSFKEGEAEKPFLVSAEFTLSFHEKSNLFKILTGFIGLKEGMVYDFDPEKDLLGKTGLINIKHKLSNSGNAFAKIENASPLMKGVECPDQVNDLTYFFMGWEGKEADFDTKKFNSLPEFIQKKIADSPEYASAHSMDTVMKDAESVFEDTPKKN